MAIPILLSISLRRRPDPGSRMCSVNKDPPFGGQINPSHADRKPHFRDSPDKERVDLEFDLKVKLKVDLARSTLVPSKRNINDVTTNPRPSTRRVLACARCTLLARLCPLMPVYARLCPSMPVSAAPARRPVRCRALPGPARPSPRTSGRHASPDPRKAPKRRNPPAAAG